MKLTKTQISLFQETILQHFSQHERKFSWRQPPWNPYHIFVSEVMLQQTQTKRVSEKFPPFITKFPNFASLASAPLYDLLNTWQGLGYNRRALALQKSARIIMDSYHGNLPPALITLPGIGPNTAASITTFAFNKPTVFIETNIRTVFIHLFFKGKTNITDTEILDLVKQTLDTQNPRIWYYALMDYGSMLKSRGINPIHQSKHYQKQSKFSGSDRQIRGAILKHLLANNHQTSDQIMVAIQATPERITSILQQLQNEHFIQYQDGLFYIQPG